MAKDAKHTVILGAGYAGLMTALRLSRRSGGTERITLVNASDTFVERIRLHQVASDQPQVAVSIASLIEDTGIVFVRARVTEIDPAAQLVHLEDLSPLPYDQLVYALGSRTETTSVPGIAEHAFTLDGSLDQLRLALESAAKRGGRVTVCGSGLTGIELTSEIAESYPTLQLTMVSRSEPGADLSARARDHLQRAFEKLGVRVVKQGVSEIHASNITTADGTLLPHDVCLWAGGFVAHPLAAHSGIGTNERQQILTDTYLRSISHPNIYAVGDSAKAPRECGQTYSACAVSMAMGAYLADELAGVTFNAFSFRSPGFCISLGRKDGLIQPYGANERPLDTIYTGRMGAFIKESICRYTIRMLRMTRRWGGVYRWFKRVAPVPQSLPAGQTRLAS